MQASQTVKMKDIITTELLINNKLVPASDKGTFDLYSPHTGEVVAKGF
jgi:aldehyde dehydrogenase (NAD+)